MSIFILPKSSREKLIIYGYQFQGRIRAIILKNTKAHPNSLKPQRNQFSKHIPLHFVDRLMKIILHYLNDSLLCFCDDNILKISLNCPYHFVVRIINMITQLFNIFLHHLCYGAISEWVITVLAQSYNLNIVQHLYCHK